MKYLGSKNRIAKYILPLMLLKYKEGQSWVEPFVGGANMIDKVPSHINRIGGDSNFYLIQLLKAVQNGWIPPDKVTEEMYYDIKANKDSFEPCLVGFVGFCCSFGGKFFAGYVRNSNSRDYALEGRYNLTKQSKNLIGVNFHHCNYYELDIPDNSIIYCDPPYNGTTKYKHRIDYNHFYKWLYEMKEIGHTIFVSEYNMPDDFICIWNKSVGLQLDNNAPKQIRVEKLFTL